MLDKLLTQKEGRRKDRHRVTAISLLPQHGRELRKPFNLLSLAPTGLKNKLEMLYSQ